MTGRAYRAPTRQAEAELREKGSRFLAIICPVCNEHEARQKLFELSDTFAQATHVCSAWRVGDPAREGRSDAGEPAGTAGMPMLQVLRGQEVSDVLAVVVRWFGGTKLGKGGLARAYAGAATLALAGLELEERQPSVTLKVNLPYARVGEIKRLVHHPAVIILDESYGERVEVTLKVFRSAVEDLEESLGAMGVEAEELGA